MIENIDNSDSFDLRSSPDAPRAARRHVASLLRSWGRPDSVVETAQLLVSELVSNAVLHGSGTIIRLSVSRIAGGRRIRVEVCNHGDAEPVMRRPAAEDLSGRGLQLVQELSRAWGSSNHDGETSVWLELLADAAG